jgi:signal transduction histidine kinase
MTDVTLREPAAGRRPRRQPLRFVSAVMLVVVAGVVVASSLITLHVIRDQERLILRESTAEVAAVLGGNFTNTKSSLQLLGAIARSGKGHPALFAAAAHSVATPNSQAWVVTTQTGTGLRVTAATGNGPAVGQLLSGARAQLARRALSANGLVFGLVRGGPSVRLVIALGQAAGRGTVVWRESALSPATPVPSTPTSPWHSLNIALYLSAHPDPSALVVTTVKGLPLQGLQYPFRVGADTWLIVADSPRPLVGWLAQDMPWIILVIGAFVAVLLTAVVETLGRRRDDAAALVKERTASLLSTSAELETAEAILVRQENLVAVGQLASTVGHELRNPLAVVTNVLYLMEAGAGSDPSAPMHRHVATAKLEISAATLIVSDLLDFAAGRQPILAPVQVSDLVTETLSVAPPPEGIQVIEHNDPEILMEADRDQIRQGLLNLITNAYDAMMPGGGVLTVSTTSVSGSVHITVTDTGSGMSAETRDSIFTPFFTSKPRGIGLGLAVTKRVIDAHGGEITVDSTPLVGTSFTLTLRAAAAMMSVPR